MHNSRTTLSIWRRSLRAQTQVNGKELLGLFGLEATYRGKKIDLFRYYLIGPAYGRDNQFPKIPTATYATWAYALGGAPIGISRAASLAHARVRLDHHSLSVPTEEA